jgi:hypothetical protein
MLAGVVGRAGYFGCLVLLGVVLMSVSCILVFGATGAITMERGARVAPPPVEVAAKPPEQPRGEAARAVPTDLPRPTEPPAPTAAPAATRPAIVTPTTAPAAATKPAPPGTVPPAPPKVGPEGSIAQRLDREAVGGSLKLRALGAAKTTQGDSAVLAIYVRLENVGSAPVKIDPNYFKLVDRQNQKYAISKALEASLPAIDLNPASQPGGAGQNTEGNLTFEIPKSAAGLALTYEPSDGPPIRIPLPPEFG